MADFHGVNEILESEKKRLICQLKKDSITKDEIEFWTKTEKIHEDFYRQNYEDLYRRSEAATRKLFDEFEKESKSISELNFWEDIEHMRGEYHYPEKECFLRENIDEVKEDKTSNGQDDIGNELIDESSNDLNETGNEPDENGNESDENSQIQNKEALTKTKKQDFTQNAVVPIESSESSPWIASETFVYFPEVKADETSVIRYVYTTCKFYNRSEYENSLTNIPIIIRERQKNQRDIQTHKSKTN